MERLRGYRSKRGNQRERREPQQTSEQPEEGKVAPARRVSFKTLPIQEAPAAAGQVEQRRRRLNPVAEIAGSSAALFLDPEATHTPLRLISDTVSPVLLQLGLLLVPS